ncbi:MAG: dihydropyrimidinase [Hyphomicrobiaceae bacterium]|nr:dihydropyrimidinase [Hyphomicrobiaceae bacterium]
MSGFDLTVRGGTIVTASGETAGDVGVKDGVITQIAEGLEPGAEDIDAAGKLVLPGGIDGHCHIEQLSSFGLMNSDDFFTASVAAAHGGTTTVVPFAAQHRGQSISDVVKAYRALAEEKAAIDYHFHIIVTDPTEDVLTKELPPLLEDGFRTLKLFLTYDLMKVDDYQTLQVMEVARKHGALIVTHAENNEMIRWATEKLVKNGHTEPKFHAVSHPRLAEAEAVHRAIILARFIDVPIMIFHVTTREAMDEVRRAQEAGLKVYAETCTQYLVLTSDDLDRPGGEGAKFCCSPPLRDDTDVEAMWQGLADGTFVTLSSDHAPYAYDETGKLNAGDNPTFKQIPNGLPGLELRMPVLFSEGVKTGRINLPKFVELTSTGIARLYGLYPQKGEIAVGSDADIAVWDPDAEKTISDDMVHDNTGYSPFTGHTITGWPECVISRGRIIVRDGKTDMAPGSGKIAKRELSDQAKPLGRIEPEMDETKNFGIRLLD